LPPVLLKEIDTCIDRERSFYLTSLYIVRVHMCKLNIAPIGIIGKGIQKVVGKVGKAAAVG
jgi:hypothetical protein